MNVRKEIYKMTKKLVIFPIMLMIMVFGCGEQEVLPTTPTKSFEGSGRYIPQSYTPTPEKGTVTSIVNNSTTNIQELEKRILELEQNNTILERCLATMVSAIYHTHEVDSFQNRIMEADTNSLNWSWRTEGDCKDWREIYYVRKTR